ncbi:MAG: hypothetical protein MUF49_30110 [Oculatellaceae cyanobacterium Prado106]|nr:hypothetical protein [Oculatellaceae cyanobacterium Prado106]
MTEPPILQVNYRQDAASLQVSPSPPRQTNQRENWPQISLQHHQQPALQTPEFQPVQHLLIVHLGHEVGVDRRLGGVRQRAEHHPGEVTVIPAQCNYQLTTQHPSEILLMALEPHWVSQLIHELIDPDHIEILPCFAQTDALISGIGQTLNIELASYRPADSLYIEALSNALALHLLRQYGGRQQQSIRNYQDYPQLPGWITRVQAQSSPRLYPQPS